MSNPVLVPPLRYRLAEDNVRSLSRSVTDCLAEFAEAAGEGLPPRELWERMHELPRRATQARLSVDDASESQRRTRAGCWPEHHRFRGTAWRTILTARDELARMT
ncbi:hypothetical protein [Saccharopolyspora sp. CA-218241]|uniref:hypothetical protein n=1 Tax=Saccharopolyspora sp. CA-218241 TaxID=3240027 RepID=UPI003D9549C1